jgi:hypothetical protein
MKPGLITIIIILSFSVLITADKSLYNQKRYLQTPTAGDQLLLLGFERFTLGKELDSGDEYSYNIKFFPVFKKYGKIDTLNKYNVTVGLKFNDGKEESETITCNRSITQLSEYIESRCSIPEFNRRGGVEIILVNLTFFPDEIDKIKVEKSSPAKKLMENLLNANTSDMFVFHFYLIDVVVKEQEVILEGNISSPKNLTESTALLTLNDKDYNCSITNFQGKAYTHEISFSLNENMTMNESLDHQVMDIDGRGRVILFVTDHALTKRIEFPKNTTYEDQIKNHTKTNQFLVDLLGFQDFALESDGTAKGKAYFRGTFDSLIELTTYIRVKVLATNKTKLLRSLADEEVKYENITAIGKKIKNFDDIESKRMVSYEMEYNKKYYQELVRFWDDIEFSDYISFPEDKTFKAKDLNLSTSLADPESVQKNGTLEYRTMEINKINRKQNGKSFIFEFQPKESLSVTKTNATVNFIPFINETNGEKKIVREEMNCTYLKNISTYQMTCRPEKNIKTKISTWVLKIWKIDNDKTLRNLQGDDKGNTTIYMEKLESNDDPIEFTYITGGGGIPKIKKKGLSAGAIVAIVLATVAVVAAVIVALLLLKTGPKPPMEADKISIPNSSTNINH